MPYKNQLKMINNYTNLYNIVSWLHGWIGENINYETPNTLECRLQGTKINGGNEASC